MKYWPLKIEANEWLLKYSNLTGSLYKKNGAAFRNKVEQEERRLIERAKLILLTGEKERQDKSLKDRAGR